MDFIEGYAIILMNESTYLSEPFKRCKDYFRIKNFLIIPSYGICSFKTTISRTVQLPSKIVFSNHLRYLNKIKFEERTHHEQRG